MVLEVCPAEALEIPTDNHFYLILTEKSDRIDLVIIAQKTAQNTAV